MTLNSLGHLVGDSSTSVQNSWLNIWQSTPQSDHAFYFTIQGGPIPLQTLNGTSGLPFSINDHDQIVGESYTSAGVIHGFLTRPGGPAIDLNSLIPQGAGFTIMAGVRIDDQGVILAMAQDASGATKYVTLTPNAGVQVPEPTPLVLFGLAAGYLAVRSLVRRART